MSITIVDTPNDLDFCKNPLAFKVTGDNYISAAGSEAYIGITWSAGDSDGEGFDLTLLDYTLEFRCATTPDDSGLQYPPKGAESLEAWKQIVVTYLKKNYYLAKYYEVNYFAPAISIKIEAKEVGAAYDIVFANDSGYSSEDANVGGVDRAVQVDYKIYVQLFIEAVYGSGTFEAINDILIDPDEDGSGIVYINKKLESAFTDHELPTFNSSDIEIFTKSIKQYFLKFAEFYGSTPAIKLLYISDTRMVLNGRLPSDKFPGHDFYGSLANSLQFLSNKPKTRDTWKQSQQFLFFLYTGRPAVGDVIYVNCVLHDRSGLSLSTAIVNTGDAEQDDLLCIPCGYEQMDIGSLADVYKYDIYLYKKNGSDPSERLSETITFIVQDNPPIFHTFLYKNDFGVWETLEVVKQTEGWKTDKETARKTLAYDYDIPDRELQSFAREASPIFKANTRIMPKNDALALRELLLNDELYLIGNDDYIPCELISGSFELVDENDDLYSVKFSYRYAYINNWIAETTRDAVTSDVGSYDIDYSEVYD